MIGGMNINYWQTRIAICYEYLSDLYCFLQYLSRQCLATLANSVFPAPSSETARRFENRRNHISVAPSGHAQARNNALHPASMKPECYPRSIRQKFYRADDTDRNRPAHA